MERLWSIANKSITETIDGLDFFYPNIRLELSLEEHCDSSVKLNVFFHFF